MVECVLPGISRSFSDTSRTRWLHRPTVENSQSKSAKIEQIKEWRSSLWWFIKCNLGWIWLCVGFKLYMRRLYTRWLYEGSTPPARNPGSATGHLRIQKFRWCIDMNEYSRKLRENVLFYTIRFSMEKSILSYSFEFFRIEFYGIYRIYRGLFFVLKMKITKNSLLHIP